MYVTYFEPKKCQVKLQINDIAALLFMKNFLPLDLFA